MYWFIFIGNSIILTKKGDKYGIPESSQPPILLNPWDHLQVLPQTDGKECKSYGINTIPKGGLPEGMTTMELRASFKVLPRNLYDMAGKAWELHYWDINNRFCGFCGGNMSWTGDICKTCDNCKRECWPQVTPATIVRIRKPEVKSPDGNILEPEKVLLVHAHNFRRAEYYGLVAGFLETGETLEQCVRREVREEVGIEITNLRYFGSQPWPYPCGVMIGFTADYLSGSIHLQEEELSRGGWFDINHLPMLPDKLSIARMLIDDWIVSATQKDDNYAKKNENPTLAI